MTFSSLPQRITSRCIDHRILKKRWRDIEKNDRRADGDEKDDYDIKLSPWTVCQFEFDEDYLSNDSDCGNSKGN
jgi:hypothetical protein